MLGWISALVLVLTPIRAYRLQPANEKEGSVPGAVDVVPPLSHYYEAEMQGDLLNSSLHQSPNDVIDVELEPSYEPHSGDQSVSGTPATQAEGRKPTDGRKASEITSAVQSLFNLYAAEKAEMQRHLLDSSLQQSPNDVIDVELDPSYETHSGDQSVSGTPAAQAEERKPTDRRKASEMARAVQSLFDLYAAEVQGDSLNASLLQTPNDAEHEVIAPEEDFLDVALSNAGKEKNAFPEKRRKLTSSTSSEAEKLKEPTDGRKAQEKTDVLQLLPDYYRDVVQGDLQESSLRESPKSVIDHEMLEPPYERASSHQFVLNASSDGDSGTRLADDRNASEGADVLQSLSDFYEAEELGDLLDSTLQQSPDNDTEHDVLEPPYQDPGGSR